MGKLKPESPKNDSKNHGSGEDFPQQTNPLKIVQSLSEKVLNPLNHTPNTS